MCDTSRLDMTVWEECMSLLDRRLSLTALLAAAAIGLAACSTPGSTSTTSGGPPLRIGMSLPLSGPVADVAKRGYEGYQLWAAKVNSGGGLLGRKVELVVHDDGFEQNAVVANYNRLIS